MKELIKKTEEKIKKKTLKIKSETKQIEEEQNRIKKYTSKFQKKIKDYLLKTNLVEEIEKRFEFYIKNVGPKKEIFKGYVKPEHIYPLHIHDDGQDKDQLIYHGYLGNQIFVIAIPKYTYKNAFIEDFDADENGKEFTFKNIESELWVEIGVQIGIGKQWRYQKKNLNGAEMTTQEILDCEEIQRINLNALHGVGCGLNSYYDEEGEINYHEKGDMTDSEYLLYLLDEYISTAVASAKTRGLK